MFSLTTSTSRSALRTAALRGAQISSFRWDSTRFYSSTMHDNDPQVLEREKFRNLSKMQQKFSPHENAPGWNEKLASASEAAVKADKSSGLKEELVSDTVRFLRARDESEQNGENSEATTASYARDEVSGPLKGVGKEEKEEVIIEEDTVVVGSEGAKRVVKEMRKEVKRTTPRPIEESPQPV